MERLSKSKIQDISVELEIEMEKISQVMKDIIDRKEKMGDSFNCKHPPYLYQKGAELFESCDSFMRNVRWLITHYWDYQKKEVELLLKNCNDFVGGELNDNLLLLKEKDIYHLFFDDSDDDDLHKLKIGLGNVIKDMNEKSNEENDSDKTDHQPEPTKTNSRIPNKSIKDYMLVEDGQKDSLLTILHSLIDGKKGKDVALVILVCVQHGLIKKPEHDIMKKTFGEIGAKSGYNSYFGKGLSAYSPEEIKGIETHLSSFIDGL